MPRKYPKSANIPTSVRVGKDMYVSWAQAASKDMSPADKEKFIKSVAGADHFEAVNHDITKGNYRRDFSNLAPHISGRPGLTRDDYEWFRPDEATPNSYRGIIAACDDAYKTVGLIRNIIDLMGDFACQGIRITHPNKSIERFYRRWWKKVNGSERSERFTNNICRLANVIIRRDTGILPQKEVDKMMKVSGAFLDGDKPAKREVPIKYTFFHPATVEQVGGPTAAFVEKKLYSIRLPANIRKAILNPASDLERQVIAQLPADIIEAARSNQPVLLPPDSTFVYHYKKDDWASWGLPMIYAILDDITHLNKLRLADTAALDGLIHHVRIFKLGNLEFDIPPTAAGVEKLSEMLQANTGGGTIDIIWGPDIELIESKQENYAALNEEKYRPTLNAIYQALGIPPTLTGTYGTAGTTNNYISLQTLVERLKYIRGILTTFWEQEIEYIRKAMNWRLPAKVEFDFMSLGNKESMLALYIQLADRNILSDEAMQLIFGQDPEMEKVRLNREAREREGGRMVPKAGPWFDPQFEEALMKIALQSGIVTPSQVGLELEPNKRGEKNALEQTALNKPVGVPNSTTKKGVPQQGRPKNVKDSKKRKTKKFTPKKKAALELWAAKAQDAVAKIVNPLLLESLGKTSFRAVSDADLISCEDVKFGVLSNIEPFKNIDEEFVLAQLKKPALFSTKDWCDAIKADLNRDLTIDEIRKVQISMYTYTYGRD